MLRLGTRLPSSTAAVLHDPLNRRVRARLYSQSEAEDISFIAAAAEVKRSVAYAMYDEDDDENGGMLSISCYGRNSSQLNEISSLSLTSEANVPHSLTPSGHKAAEWVSDPSASPSGSPSPTLTDPHHHHDYDAPELPLHVNIIESDADVDRRMREAAAAAAAMAVQQARDLALNELRHMWAALDKISAKKYAGLDGLIAECPNVGYWMEAAGLILPGGGAAMAAALGTDPSAIDAGLKARYNYLRGDKAPPYLVELQRLLSGASNGHMGIYERPQSAVVIMHTDEDRYGDPMRVGHWHVDSVDCLHAGIAPISCTL